MPSNTLHNAWPTYELSPPESYMVFKGRDFASLPRMHNEQCLHTVSPPVNICWVKWVISYCKDFSFMYFLVYFLTLIAFWISMHESLMVCNNLLNRPISWTSTVFMLWVYVVGYLLIAASTSKLWGSLPKMSPATSSTTSSEDFAPASAERDCRECKRKTRTPQ